MSLIDRRIRGFRLIDIVAMAILTAIVLGVYLAKTIAGRERAEIARVERKIDIERKRIRLLHAEVAFLEQPERIERLSTAYLGLGPVGAKREASIEDIGRIAVKEPRVEP
jgi:hypothetical protein